MKYEHHDRLIITFDCDVSEKHIFAAKFSISLEDKKLRKHTQEILFEFFVPLTNFSSGLNHYLIIH